MMTETKELSQLAQFVGWPIVIDGNGYEEQLCMIVYGEIDLGGEHGYMAYLPVEGGVRHMAIRLTKSKVDGLFVRPAFLQEIVDVEWSYGYTEIFFSKIMQPAIKKRMDKMSASVKKLLSKVERQQYEINDLNTRLRSLKRWR